MRVRPPSPLELSRCLRVVSQPVQDREVLLAHRAQNDLVAHPVIVYPRRRARDDRVMSAWPANWADLIRGISPKAWSGKAFTQRAGHRRDSAAVSQPSIFHDHGRSPVQGRTVPDRKIAAQPTAHPALSQVALLWPAVSPPRATASDRVPGVSRAHFHATRPSHRDEEANPKYLVGVGRPCVSWSSGGWPGCQPAVGVDDRPGFRVRGHRKPWPIMEPGWPGARAAAAMGRAS
jgi:hypothetical protein